MTQKQITLKKHLVRMIHINSKNVFNAKEERILFMKSRFGKSSTLDMSIDELKLLLKFCERKVSDVKGNLLSSSQKNKIKILWKQKARNKNDDALFSFILKITNTSSQSIDDILMVEATKVIVALTKMN